MREALKVWLRNERQIEEAIINGEETQVVESDFGANEFVIDFLKEMGFSRCHNGNESYDKKG
jgi:hypothetical protein